MENNSGRINLALKSAAEFRLFFFFIFLNHFHFHFTYMHIYTAGKDLKANEKNEKSIYFALLDSKTYFSTALQDEN